MNKQTFLCKIELIWIYLPTIDIADVLIEAVCTVKVAGLV